MRSLGKLNGSGDMVIDGRYCSISHMNEKFEFYDILGIIVPGIMLMCFGVLCFPETAKALSISNYPQTDGLLFGLDYVKLKPWTDRSPQAK
jgi:hypothetical protein